MYKWMHNNFGDRRLVGTSGSRCRLDTSILVCSSGATEFMRAQRSSYMSHILATALQKRKAECRFWLSQCLANALGTKPSTLDL